MSKYALLNEISKIANQELRGRKMNETTHEIKNFSSFKDFEEFIDSLTYDQFRFLSFYLDKKARLYYENPKILKIMGCPR